MSARRLTPLLTAGLLALCGVLSTLAEAAPAKSRAGSESTLLRDLVHSHELWATIDICNPPDQPDTVGIRGSMPSDDHAKDQMYMSFRLQYEEAKTGRWYDLPGLPTPAFVAVGSGSEIRQGGSSFQLKPRARKAAFTLRGVVDYEWRRGSRIIQMAARATSASHKSLAGADPGNYSAASCLIG